jgi:hypothetical protein
MFTDDYLTSMSEKKSGHLIRRPDRCLQIAALDYFTGVTFAAKSWYDLKLSLARSV